MSYQIINKIYSVDEVNELLDFEKSIIKTRKKIKYYNIASSFDIETTSFYENNEKRAIMYAWGFGINGKCVIGRTWDEFINTIDYITTNLELNENKRLIIYVHNLAYEFQFICKRFEWLKVFALDNRKPVQAVTKQGIEFRCSYILSGYPLVKVGENLLTYKVSKIVGALDYSLIRGSNTSMTIEELNYLLNDNLVVMSYIQETMERDGDITKIPLTKTSYVRNACRKKCLPNNKALKQEYYQYYNIIKNLTIKDIEEYRQLKRAFQGGFTHANILYSGVTLNDVTSIDFTSSYPYCMIAFQYPMSMGKKVNIKNYDDFENYINKYNCLFDLSINNLKNKYSETPISLSKCYESVSAYNNNGRVLKAKRVSLTCTEIDFEIIKQFYTYDNIEVRNMRVYKKDYLPTPFVQTILQFYQDKTTLKGVEGKEVEYMSAKENVNSLYGMCVTDILQEEYCYDNLKGWYFNDNQEYDKLIQHHNESRKRFLFYPWGVWVTAYARRNLFTGILETCKTNDYVYSDTDSLKMLNYENHVHYVQAYNNDVKSKLEKAMKHHNLDFELVAPKTITGVTKMLGVYDMDGEYNIFRTLGAKRYLYYDKEKHLNLVVSGLNKKIVIPYLLEKYNNDIDAIFKAFKEGLYIPKGKTGKNIHTYIDEPLRGIIIDYKGIPNEYNELSVIHLEESDYKLTLSDEYISIIFEMHRLRM